MKNGSQLMRSRHCLQEESIADPNSFYVSCELGTEMVRIQVSCRYDTVQYQLLRYYRYHAGVGTLHKHSPCSLRDHLKIPTYMAFAGKHLAIK